MTSRKDKMKYSNSSWRISVIFDQASNASNCIMLRGILWTYIYPPSNPTLKTKYVLVALSMIFYLAFNRSNSNCICRFYTISWRYTTSL